MPPLVDQVEKASIAVETQGLPRSAKMRASWLPQHLAKLNTWTSQVIFGDLLFHYLTHATPKNRAC